MNRLSTFDFQIAKTHCFSLSDAKHNVKLNFNMSNARLPDGFDTPLLGPIILNFALHVTLSSNFLG